MNDAGDERPEHATTELGAVDELERQIAAVIATVAGREPSSSDSDFVALGLDSLALLDILALLEERFEVELTEDIVSEFKSIASIAAVLRETNKRFSGTGRGVDWDW